MTSGVVSKPWLGFFANPLVKTVTAVVIVSVLILFNQISCWFALAYFLVGVSGMIVVAVLHFRAKRMEREKEQRLPINYAKLASMDISRVPAWLKDNVRGHDQVIEAIVTAIANNLQLARPGRTLGNFLLVGPTGTGKSFLSRLVSAALFPDSEPVMLTMNQYKQPGDVFTLIGPPPGMPGYEVGGRLTRPVLENPYRVVIFDELEKAHHDLHDCLYNILDTAACVEKSSGRTVDFSGCVFFATCNAGVDELRRLAEEVGASQLSAAWLGRSRDALAEAAGFDRAFLSRWSGVYLMDQLAPIHVAEVACLELARYWRDYGVEVTYVAPELILEAVQRNQEFTQYGVRQLGRYIREKTDAAIIEAKRKSVVKVRLTVSPSGEELQIEASP